MKRLIQMIIIAALLVTPVVAVPLLAEEGDESATVTTKRLSDERRAEIKEKIKARREGRLDAAKKTTCEKRVAVITRIMTNAAKMGTKHLGVFDKILERVQTFYTEKKLAVDNYDEVVAAAASKKEAAVAAIEAVENNVAFDCSSENPVGKVNAFNGKVRAMHQALKDYRMAIKDVIKVVKQAAQATESTEGEGEE
jgi:hypothetical protein